MQCTSILFLTAKFKMVEVFRVVFVVHHNFMLRSVYGASSCEASVEAIAKFHELKRFLGGGI